MGELCSSCRSSGLDECMFKQLAEFFARDLRMDPQEKHIAILQERETAREKMCPNLNDIDPYYPGKENF
jgi:hypothetical protein